MAICVIAMTTRGTSLGGASCAPTWTDLPDGNTDCATTTERETDSMLLLCKRGEGAYSFPGDRPSVRPLTDALP